ncbi:hypothetical protein BDN71DRAFT_1492902, partial [Pleurotus eryngii]
MLLSQQTLHHSTMPRTVKSDPRVRGVGSNQTPQTQLSHLTLAPRVTRSTKRAIHPTSISAQVASHAARPPTRRSKRRSRKRGPSGSRPNRNPVAGSTSLFPTHEDSAGAKIDSTQRTIKKPRLEDFKTESENEEEDGGNDEHDKAPQENEMEALEIIPGTSPRFLNDSTH